MKTLFAGVISAQKTTRQWNGVEWNAPCAPCELLAENKHEAIGLLLEIAVIKYPPKEGYREHKANVIEISVEKMAWSKQFADLKESL